MTDVNSSQYEWDEMENERLYQNIMNDWQEVYGDMLAIYDDFDWYPNDDWGD